MKVSDYIVEYLIGNGVTDVFGYPGGMVTHLMDSLDKYSDRISAHVTYNEQGAAMAACGYAQATGITGVAYATSGPGATNLITGICNAYMDSIPTVFITGQVNSFEQRGTLPVRQRGFQETDIVSMVKPCTKWAESVNDPLGIKGSLDRAFYEANDERRGPVLLDIAMDVLRADVDVEALSGYSNVHWWMSLSGEEADYIRNRLTESVRPVILLGRGVDQKSDGFAGMVELLNQSGIPVVTSMIATDLSAELENYYGYIGAYGDRAANFIVAKCDMLITVGARLDVRQVGARRENFAPNAKIIRIDIDAGELQYKVHDDEYDLRADGIEAINQFLSDIKLNDDRISQWKTVCDKIAGSLSGIDDREENRIVAAISEGIPEGAMITTDVGQNQVWVAQSYRVKPNQRIFYSGGHGAMGYSLPAAIGVSIGTGKTVYSFNGDGGIQMNIQELQVIAREKLPIKVIIFNNYALGMIRHFQEMYFDGNYCQTVRGEGFDAPDFSKIADAYGIRYARITSAGDVAAIKDMLIDDESLMLEVIVDRDTYVFPKLEYGKPNQDQEPLIDRELYNRLMEL